MNDNGSLNSDLMKCSSYEPIMSMEAILVGEEPQVLCVDDQMITLFCIMATLKSFGKVCIGKLSGLDAVDLVKVRL